MTPEKTTVSVIVPCYNDGIYLEEAVKSVLASTYPNVEAVIVNDGSTDNTNEIGKKLQQQFSNVKYIEKKNEGLPKARNMGIAEAKGDLILPLDADDKISKDYISEAVHLFEQDRNNQLKLVYCNAQFFGKKQGEWKLKDFSLKKIAKDNMIFCSAVYRKEDWAKIGGYSPEMLGGWEDWEFWISMLKNGGDVVRLPITGFFYRIKENSMRKGMTKKLKSEKINFLNKRHRDFFQKQLNGPLRKSRSLSKPVNNIAKILGARKSFFL
ncbi:Glycosyl transferase family 2 [Mariniphaga anaerophila]|uniref:Glycosyl transferase family 2 n=1 Tax=Mariniphaga anaerophila TaxID=1484053 RepID=A0A1M4SYV7_9BACT|nr:glycosyltransferase family A protein [Mariniphaga anaerophila]SHE37334.1 Glycosyl transferase family 2 [Mariniphaga anaerophila]